MFGSATSCCIKQKQCKIPPNSCFIVCNGAGRRWQRSNSPPYQIALIISVTFLILQPIRASLYFCAPSKCRSAGPLPWWSEQKMTTTINPRTSPHPLKGIVNTNDDPTQCARCQQNIDWNDTGDCLLLVCCGKVICDACAGTERFHCIFCRKVRSTTRSLNPKEMVSKVKKHAKRGYAWAQLTLGCIYLHL